MDDKYELRSSELWDEVRFQIEDTETGLTMEGPMAVYNTPSKVLSIADLATNERSQLERTGKRHFREILHPGAFKKSLADAPDIVLHYQHNENSLPLGRTKAGTMTLTDGETAVRARAELPDNEWGRPVRDAVRRGDIGGISYRMGPVQSWFTTNETLADGYTGVVRHVKEVKLRREISLVTFPGYIETAATIRALAEEADIEPDKLAEAFEALRTPEAKLSDEQHDLLMAAINARVETPYINPKLASMRERLAALAG